MNLYKMRYKKLWMLCAISMSLYGQQSVVESQAIGQLDPMHDFAYPVSVIQSARQDLSQAVYSLQQQNFDQAISYLQKAVSTLVVKNSQELSPDDAEHIAQMIAQISDIVGSHTADKRAVIETLCQQINQSL